VTEVASVVLYITLRYSVSSLLLYAAGAKVTDTIRKGIIDIEPYENNTALLMVGNVAALTGIIPLFCDNSTLLARLYSLHGTPCECMCR